jgi:hypothetical protein
MPIVAWQIAAQTSECVARCEPSPNSARDAVELRKSPKYRFRLETYAERIEYAALNAVCEARDIFGARPVVTHDS